MAPPTIRIPVRVSVYSRADAGLGMGAARRGHRDAGSVEPSADLSVWPPVGAVAVDVADGYERLAAHGYEYGPAFRGLTAMWSRGDELFAEVQLPDVAGGVGGFGVHPALLDAALHAVVIGGDLAQTGRNELAVLLAGRVVACRGRVGGAGPDRADRAVGGVDRAGRRAGLPVLSVASMVARPVTEQQLVAAVPGRTGVC